MSTAPLRWRDDAEAGAASSSSSADVAAAPLPASDAATLAAIASGDAACFPNEKGSWAEAFRASARARRATKIVLALEEEEKEEEEAAEDKAAEEKEAGTREDAEEPLTAGVVADPLARTRIVGFAAFASGSMAFDVQRVAVHPSARRRGHATRLLASVLAAARARGAALVRLRVRDAGAEAEAAIGAYLKSGFRFETRGTEGGDGGGGGADGGRARGRVLRDYYGPGEHAREMVAEIERRPK
jgi:ribosomal protein S18 acetylase RimI-like enzyme